MYDVQKQVKKAKDYQSQGRTDLGDELRQTGYIIYLSAIERLICRRGMSLIGFTSFSLAQNMMHNFQNTVLNSSCHCLRQVPQ